MEANKPNALEASALKILAERSGKKNLVIVGRNTAVAASTGQTLYKFDATSKDTPNEAPVSLTLNEGGAEVDLLSLSALEGVTLFEPPTFVLPPLVLPAPPITINPTTNNLVL